MLRLEVFTVISFKTALKTSFLRPGKTVQLYVSVCLPLGVRKRIDIEIR